MDEGPFFLPDAERSDPLFFLLTNGPFFPPPPEQFGFCCGVFFLKRGIPFGSPLFPGAEKTV